MTSLSDERNQVQIPLMRDAAKRLGTQLVHGNALERSESDVLLPSVVRDAITRLNPHLDAKAHENALREFERLLASVRLDTITEKAQEILSWIRGAGQAKDKDGRKRGITLIDMEHLEHNSWVAAYEVTYKASAGREVRFDGVLYCNGIPLVIAEFKSNTSETTSWLSAAKDLAGGYTTKAPAMMATSLVSLATDGRELRYGAVRTPAARYQVWGSSDPARPTSGLKQVQWDWDALTSPDLLLLMAQDLILHVTDKSTSSLVRVVPRWPQVEAAPIAALRALDPEQKRGLFDHFQGSGKTYTMAMAANVITRKDPRHAVVLVVDRLDLLSQHKKDFASSDLRRTIVEAETSGKLKELLSDPHTSGIIITTIHRFDEAGLLSKRADFTVMVDEAHRTQEGLLAEHMRRAVPNATLLGFTGTPLSDGDKNTYETFGSPTDAGRVAHRYSAADSVRDGTTVALHVLEEKLHQKLNSAALDAAFAAYAEANDLSSGEKEDLADRLGSASELYKDPRRVELVASDVATRMTETFLPAEYGGMLVVVDRKACVLYADLLKEKLGTAAVTAVISTTKNDDESILAYERDPVEEAKVVKNFRDPKHPLKLLVVTSKLLTGFDAKNCGVVFVDKPMRAHTLFQAVTRANRAWTRPSGIEKEIGTVVDYCGITPHLLAAFDHSGDDPTITEFTSTDKLRRVFRSSLKGAERVLSAGFDWRDKEFVFNATEILAKDTRLLERFRKHVLRASSIWELLSKDHLLAKEKGRLGLVVRILTAQKAPDTGREMTYLAHGQAILDLIVEHTGDIKRVEGEGVKLTPDKIRELLRYANDPSSKTELVDYSEVLEKIRERLERRMRGPRAAEYRSIAEKLERFAATVYEVDSEGARTAVADLTQLVADIRHVDRVVGKESEDLDFELSGSRIRTHHSMVVANASTALQDVLKAYHPKQVAASAEQLSGVLDDLAGRSSYRHLKESVQAQKVLKSSLLKECARLGLLPKGPQGIQFVDQLVEYINEWMV